jgi:two-component system, cell cycle sensor histidine kinase and response regulator CckA
VGPDEKAAMRQGIAMEQEPASEQQLRARIAELEAQVLRYEKQPDLQQLLAAIQKTQSFYIYREAPDRLFNLLLDTVVDITGSEYGFLDEVLEDLDGMRYKLSLAMSDIAWDEDSRKVYEQLRARNLEFRNLNNLSGLPALKEELVIANDAPNDPRSGGTPPGHPVIRHYMGMPMFFGGKIIGVAGVANRKEEYTEDLAAFLAPLLNACACVIQLMRRDKAEQQWIGALHESERRFRAIADYTIDWESWLDPDGKLLWVNTAVEKHTGYSVAACMAMADYPMPIIHESDKIAFQCFMEEARRGGEENDRTFRIQRKNGEDRWISISWQPLRDNDGFFSGWRTSARDITNRHHIEMQLRESEDRLRAIFDNMPIGMFQSTPEGRFLYVNPALVEMLRFESADALIGEVNAASIADALYADPGRRPELVREVHEAAGGWKTFYNEYRRHDGGAFTGMIRFCERRDPGNGQVTLYGFVEDITEQKLVQDQLRESEDRLRSVLEQSSELIYRRNLITGAYDYLSPAARALTGFTAEALSAMPVEEIIGCIHPEDQEKVLRSILESRNQCGGPYQLEFRFRHRTGGWRWFSEYFSVIGDETGRPAWRTGAIRDITWRHQAEEERVQLIERLQEAQKFESLSVLAGGVAHHFNNLLHVILGFTDLAFQEIPDDSPASESLHQIEDAARRAAALSTQMLACSGHGNTVREKTDISEFITGSWHVLQTLMQPEIECRFFPAQNLPWVLADPGQLRQMLANLLINAAEAIEESGREDGRIELRTGLRFYDADFLDTAQPWEHLAPGEYVFIAISDNGCGMNADVRKHLFDPFFSTKFTGRGLGMSAVAGILRAHNGCLKVESERNKGTVMRVLLPVSEQREDMKAAEEKPLYDGWQSSGTVLLVDDEQGVLLVGRQMLEICGFEVLSAKNGLEAVQQFRKHKEKIRLVVLDIMMPVMSGGEAFRVLRDIRPDLPVLIATAYDEKQLPVEVAKQPFTRVMHKPYEFNQFVDALKDLLDE